MHTQHIHTLEPLKINFLTYGIKLYHILVILVLLQCHNQLNGYHNDQILQWMVTTLQISIPLIPNML